MFFLVAGQTLLQVFNRARVCAGARIDGLRAIGQENQDRHPQVADADIDHDELAKGGFIDVEDFLHRQHVRAATDPAAGQCRHAAPGITGHGFRMDQAHHPESNERAQHHADGGADIHRQQFRPQPQHAFQVDGQGQQDQRRRQQHAAGHRVVELARIAVDQTDTVVDAGNEVAQQQGRHVGVELLPETRVTGCRPEHHA